MKIIKPFTLGLLQRPYSQARRNHLVVCALGFFALGQAVGARLLGEAAQWARVMASLPANQPLDEVMPKAQAEALVYGAACAKEPASHLHVRLRLGAIDKRLVACGPRPSWRELRAPAAVQRVPLDHRLAYGGERFDDNPVGCGAAPANSDQGPLPQWAYPEAPLTERGRPIPVAGLGARGIDWAPRRRHAGTYDAAWLRDHHPGLPLDLDWRVYNQAAEDQRLAQRHFTGGEAYCLEGLHPEHGRIVGHLPTQRVRAFVQREARLHEVALAMDTVWFLPEQSLGVAAWRGQVEVADSDALDVKALMLAYEGGTQTPRPLSHYTAVLEQRLDPETGAAAAFNEGQLAPEREASELAREAEQDTQASRAATERQAAVQAAVMAEIEQRSGVVKPPEVAQSPVTPTAPTTAPTLATPTPSAIAAGDFDLSAMISGARRMADAARADAEQRRDALLRQHPVVVPATVPAPERLEPDELARRVRVPAPAGEAKARLAAPEPVVPVLWPDQALALGQQALAWLAQGGSLAGRDLSGANLRGAMLAAQDLRACLLEHADLRGANLRGCRLDAAVLTQARLDGADLTAAQLGEANLIHARLDGAMLGAARLNKVRASHAHFSACDASGADFSEALLDASHFEGANGSHARLDATLLNQAQLGNSRWVGASFNRVVGWRLQAQGADFSATTWTRSALLEAELAGSHWRAAKLSQLHGGKANWQGALLAEVRAERCSWADARMAGADLSRGLFATCDFSRVELTGAHVEGGCFARSLFMQARLCGVQARDADFFQALLRKADFSAADLRAASLVQAELTETTHAQAQLQGLRMEARRAWA